MKLKKCSCVSLKARRKPSGNKPGKIKQGFSVEWLHEPAQDADKRIARAFSVILGDEGKVKK